MQVRLLWQQRAFSQMLAQLLSHMGQDWRKQLAHRAALLLALAHLLAAVPQAFFRHQLPQLLPMVVAGLQPLSEGPLASTDALLALLQVLNSTLVDAQGMPEERMQCSTSCIQSFTPHVTEKFLQQLVCASYACRAVDT